MPTVTYAVPARAGRVDEKLDEALDRAVDGDVGGLDATLTEQLLDLAIGEPVPQIRPHGEDDDLRREPETDPLDHSRDVWEQCVDDVIAVADHLDVERVSLIGSFVGANVALETAVRFRDRVAAVVAFHPSLVAWDVDFEERRARMLKVVDRDADAGRDELTLAAPSRAADPGFVDWFVRAGRTVAAWCSTVPTAL